MSNQFYSVTEAAKFLSVCRITIYRGINNGEIPSARLGRKVLIPAAFIDGLVSGAMSKKQSNSIPVSAGV
jgi:excisionase family DNA binding protein